MLFGVCCCSSAWRIVALEQLAGQIREATGCQRRQSKCPVGPLEAGMGQACGRDLLLLLGTVHVLGGTGVDGWLVWLHCGQWWRSSIGRDGEKQRNQPRTMERWSWVSSESSPRWWRGFESVVWRELHIGAKWGQKSLRLRSAWRWKQLWETTFLFPAKWSSAVR